MTLSPRIFSVKDVTALANRVKAIVLEELITMEYSTAGNSYRKQFSVPLPDLLVACDEYLSLYGTDAQKSPDASNTSTFLVS